MKVYIINYQKEDKQFKKVVLKATNDLTGEEVFYSGLLRDLESQKSWGEKGWLESYAEVYRDKNDGKK